VKLVALVLAATAAIAALVQIVRIRNRRDPAYRRTRWNLLAVISGSLMVLTPHTLGDVFGTQVAIWIAVGLAALALGLLFGGEKIGGNAAKRRQGSLSQSEEDKEDS